MLCCACWVCTKLWIEGRVRWIIKQQGMYVAVRPSVPVSQMRGEIPTLLSRKVKARENRKRKRKKK